MRGSTSAGMPGPVSVTSIRTRDEAFMSACYAAYNDWLYEDFCSAAPDRLIGVAMLPPHPEAAFAELTRLAAKGGVRQANLQIAVKAGGGRMDDIVWMRIYVTDMDEYRKESQNLGKVWREFFGGYYPAITLLRVAGFFDERAKVEIEAVAVLPLPRDPDDREVEVELPSTPKPAAKAVAKKK